MENKYSRRSSVSNRRKDKRTIDTWIGMDRKENTTLEKQKRNEKREYSLCVCVLYVCVKQHVKHTQYTTV
jgi:hypothetical protein